MADFPLVKTIAVDFDGVIHTYDKGWCDGKVYGHPMRDSLKNIQSLQQHGFKVVVLTARDDLEPVKDWLVKNGFNVEVTNKKPPAIAYIDDRAIRFTNWKDMKNYFI